jgi:beta-glucosidase
MVSFNAINGTQIHQHKHLVTDVLKGEMGFQGFVVSDWQGYTRNDGDYDNQIRLAINAGIDLLLAPYQSWQIIASVTNSTEAGLIDESRIDDAVRRILTVKFKAGLFEKKLYPIDSATYQPIGNSEHRAVARQAVRESLVLLKNENNVLPQAKSSRIFLAGKSADNIQNQCGGWTMSWQGTSDEARHIIVGGTTIRQGLESLGTGSVTFVEDGSGADPNEHDVAIVVVGETPYAELEGYDDDLTLDDEDQTTINNVKASGVPMVLVIVSGRPMIVTDEIEGIDAVVAAWLPGTEGDGIAEVLFGDYGFTGTLSFSWPADMTQVWNGFIGDNPNVLFPFGFGLNYESVNATKTPTTPPPVSSPSPPAAPTTTGTAVPTGTSNTRPSQCSAHPACLALSGDCCPTVDNVFLDCCGMSTGQGT